MKLFSFLLLGALAAQAQGVPAEVFQDLRWRLIGPFRGGRTVAASGPGRGSNTFYSGSVGGGVWKTTNAGLTWTPIFDSQPVASIGSIDVAPSDPQIVYAGTGESDIRSNLSSGNGVYKSTDGGATWANVGLRETRQISRLVVHPKDPGTVWVAALGHAYAPNEERGIFKSTDGGATWKRVLFVSPAVGASDLAIARDNPRVLFAGLWQAQRPPWSTYPPLEGPGGALYRSTDGGDSWQAIRATGLPDGDWGRVGVSVAPDGKRVFALIAAGKKSGLYRSDDGGDSWTLANSDPRLTSRSWYFQGVTVDPSNPDVAYVPNVALYRCEDGGRKLSIVRGAPGGDDYHQLWIDPQDPSRFALASDQGTSISLDAGKTWSSWFNQATAQMYRVITDNQYPYYVYGAQQDSGGAAVLSRTDYGQITPRDWFLPGGSESGYFAPDPSDPNIIFASTQYGGVQRFDRRTSLSQDVSPWPLPSFGSDISKRKYRATWTPVLLFSPADRKTLYLGTQYVMKTVDGGLHWEKISPDLTGADPAAVAATPTIENTKKLGYGSVFAIAPSPLKAAQIWAGTETGLIHLTVDGGKTWKDVTPPGLSDWSKISLLEASRFDPAVAYAAVDRHRLDDQKPYIYRTRDFGKTWQLISTGIAPASFARSVREDPKQKGLLYAGTEFGAYVSFDDGDHWQSLQLNLPPGSVTDLVVHGDDLVAATNGRSFWILDDIAPLRQAAAAAKAERAWLYAPATAIRSDHDAFIGTPLPPEEPTAKSAPEGAILDYFLKSAASEVKLSVYDQKHTLLRQWTNGDQPGAVPPSLPIAERWFSKPQRIEASSGMHRFLWDLRTATSGDETTPDSGDDDSSAPRGPRVPPGSYTVELTVDGKTFAQPLKITMDPRSKATPAALAEKYTRGREVFGYLRSSLKAQAEIASVRESLNGLKSKATREITATMSALEKAIGDITEGPQGLNAATAGLSAVLRVIDSGDRVPPAQAMEIFASAQQSAKRNVDEWGRLKAGLLARLNEQLKAAQLEPIKMAAIQRAVEYWSAQ